MVSGLGGELGSLVAAQLEREEWVGALEGLDADPPRRRLQRTTYHRVPPEAHDRMVEIVTRFDPHVLVHIAVWEPESRVPARVARQLTDQVATSVLGAAAECRSLEHVVLRSGIEVYGRGPTALTRPDEHSPLRPTSEFGTTLADIEDTALSVGRRVGVTVGALRFAPVLGPHVPAPLGRVLRMPAVPFNVLGDPAFALLHLTDAARALVRAAERGLDQPVNVVAAGSITMTQAARRGRRLAYPILGPQWRALRPLNWIAGAPIPEHVGQLIRHGRLADSSRTRELLGFAPAATTADVIDELYDWPSIVRQPPRVRAA